jgi:hypothetical protein
MSVAFLANTDVDTALSSTVTYFNTNWQNFVPNNVASPILPGSLDPLLSEGSSTVGNCAFACATYRIIQLNGLSDILIDDTPSVVFTNCDKYWLALVTYPLIINVTARSTFYSNQQPNYVAAGVNSALTVDNANGSFVIEVPITGLQTFDLSRQQVKFNMTINFSLTSTDSYIQAALAEETKAYNDALRESFDVFSAQISKDIRRTLGPSILKSVTIPTFTFPTVNFQTCNLSGPCHPCDHCCICQVSQMCTEDCMKCPCLTCQSSWKWTNWILVSCILIFGILLVARRMK